MKFFIYLLFILISIQAHSQFDGRFKAKEVNYSKDAIEINISTTKLMPYKAKVKKMNWTTTDNGDSIAKFSVDLEGVITPSDSSSGEDSETLIVGITNTESYEVKFEEQRLYNMEMFDYTNENLSYQEANLKIGSYNLMSKIGKTKNAKRIEITIKKSDITGDEIQILVFKGKKSDLQEKLSIQFSSKFELDYKSIPLQVKMIDDKITFTNIETQKVEWANNYPDGTHIKLLVPIEQKIPVADAYGYKEEPEIYILFVSNINNFKVTFEEGELEHVFKISKNISSGVYAELSPMAYSIGTIGGASLYINALEITLKKADIKARNIQIVVFKGKKSEFSKQFEQL